MSDTKLGTIISKNQLCQKHYNTWILSYRFFRHICSNWHDH